MTTPRREDSSRIRDVFDAAVQLPAGQREAFVAEACRDAPAVADRVRVLLASHAAAGGFLETPAAHAFGELLSPAAANDDQAVSEQYVGRVVGPYVIESLIGHGGMGTVFRARRADQAFERRVAIKMIRQGLDSADVIRRFQHERQILASLDHPYIARLYDGGTADDGVPYLVMELIDGSPIDAHAASRQLAVAGRVRLFRQVCEAVQYAHQRLVIHRDLKPSNILVQADGVPKLLDFGVAKLLDAAPGFDTTLLRPMTPAYASPEQIRGEPITTASDVYSLGVILYQLLTGRSPYPGDPRSTFEMARAVCDAEPRRPSTVVTGAMRRRLTGDLDNIVLKALRKEPHQRYASVEQFATDLRRHLDRLPVMAGEGTLGYRARKFITRHRIAVAAASVVLLAILGGTAAAAWQARAARLQAEIARAERARAERRFDDVRKLANAMVFELHDAIEDLPGATGARKLLVERALEYLDSLAQEAGGDPSLQRELADGYKRIGDLQGGPYTANVGNTPLALASYERAAAIRKALIDSGAATLPDLIGFAEVSRLTSDAQKASANPSAALDHIRRAVETLEPARAAHPHDTALLQELMRAYGTEASLYASSMVTTSLGDLSAALPLRRQQLAIAQQLHELAPADHESLKTLASALNAMGDQLLMAGQRREASEYFGRAQQLLLSISGRETSRTSLFALHDSYYRILWVQLADAELQQARTTARHAIEIAERLAAADSNDAQARLVLAADYANLGEVLAVLGAYPEAAAVFSRAVATDTDLVRRHPNTAQFRNIRFHRWLIGGRIYYLWGDEQQALRYYREAKDILTATTAQDPKNQGSRLRLAVAHNGIGSVLARLKNFDAASAAYHEALAALSTALAASSPGEDALYAAAESYAALGAIEAARAAGASGNRAARSTALREALKWTDRSLEMWQRIKEPGLTSPGGYPCTPLPEVKARRARLSAQLNE